MVNSFLKYTRFELCVWGGGGVGESIVQSQVGLERVYEFTHGVRPSATGIKYLLASS